MPIVTYLQMRERGELRPRYCDDRQLVIRETVLPQWQLNRFLYQLVGEPWHWADKLVWSDERWRRYAAKVRTFVACYGGNLAGYYELLRHPREPSVQISYFGLAPGFIGRGLGGALLTDAIEQAWAWDGNATRVWVHTCETDHPGALPNYEARGMTAYKTTVSPTPTLRRARSTREANARKRQRRDKSEVAGRKSKRR